MMYKTFILYILKSGNFLMNISFLSCPERIREDRDNFTNFFVAEWSIVNWM